MAENLRLRYQSWELEVLLQRHPGLSIVPGTNSGLLLEGALSFKARTSDDVEIADTYHLQISVPPNFPQRIPIVRETEGRIPRAFHCFPDGSLCLGAPLRLHTILAPNPTLGGFVNSCLIPFLYSRSCYEKHGNLPLGELAHGNKGILEDYQNLFQVATKEAALEMLFLLTLPKRVANKRPCPCESGRRVGVCHHMVLNELRQIRNRTWFREEYRKRVVPDGSTGKPLPIHHPRLSW